MRLLCGITSSATARHAAWVAAELARAVGAELEYAYVGRGARASDRTTGLVDALASTYGSAAPLHTVRGSFDRELTALADRNAFDLLVVGYPSRRRRGWIERGSGFRRLLRRASGPVLAIPQGTTVGTVGRVVLSYDATARSVRAALLAGRLAAAFKVPLDVAPDDRDPSATGWQLYHAERMALGAVFDGADFDVDVRVPPETFDQLSVAGSLLVIEGGRP